MRAAVDAGHWQDVAALRQELIECKGRDAPLIVRAGEFGCYSAIAMMIHVFIAIPAIFVRLITDITLGHSVFQAIKPTKRPDLF